jgi:hypothetical protein
MQQVIRKIFIFKVHLITLKLKLKLYICILFNNEMVFSKYIYY